MTGPAGFAERWFLGVRLSLLDLGGAAEAIARRPADAPFAYAVTPNAQHYVLLHRGEPGFRAAYRDAWLRLNDSQVLRGVARALFGECLPLATGSDLTCLLLSCFVAPGDAIAIVGGDAEIARRVGERFGIARIHHHVPPMGFMRDPAAVEAVIEFVERHPARYVFFAVGSPRSEIVLHEILARGRATGLGMSTGRALAFAVGASRRAPPWMRRLAIEWLHRLALAPRAHFRRVFVDSLPVLWLALRARLRRSDRRHLPPWEA